MPPAFVSDVRRQRLDATIRSPLDPLARLDWGHAPLPSRATCEFMRIITPYDTKNIHPY